MCIASSSIDKMLRLAGDTISLETTPGEHGLSIKHLIVNPSAPTPLDTAIREHYCNLANNALQVLSRREQTIIRLRYGLGVAAEHTLEEIGRKFGLTRERVRQIEMIAFRKLRSHSTLKALKRELRFN
jgi:RNA polymerase primary sigma factor